ncbi:MAG: flagellar hook-basal body protein [Phycisphaerales bacterium]|nr:flagellar hook-basal body protein [Phycisphaerales bacterium]
MNYGLWMSAAGLGSQMYRQDVLANNLANSQTTAFKPDFAQTVERPPAREEFGQLITSQELLEQLGGGVLLDRTWTDFSQGALEQSGNPLDVALDGKGFFMVRDEAGEDMLTRAGIFQRGQTGHLVDGEGRQVLSPKGRPIRLPDIAEGAIAIGRDGSMSTEGGRAFGQIAIVDADPRNLRKEGGNLYAYTGKETPGAIDPSATQLRQGWTEASAIDPVMEMSKLIDSSRAIQANSRLIGIHDEVMNLTINRLGAIA